MASALFRPHTKWNQVITLARSNRLTAYQLSSTPSCSFSSGRTSLVSKQAKPKKSVKKLVPPKRPMNIMQLVTQDVIQEFKEKNGKLGKDDARECFKIAAEKYRSLSEADKKNYTEELERRRVTYETEMRLFLESLTPDDYVNQKDYILRRKSQGGRAVRKGIPKLDPNAPKRPMNGFMIFCSELRSDPSKIPMLAEQLKASEKDSSSSVLEVSKIMAQYWRSMDDDLKRKYMMEGQRRSDQYKEEKAEYDERVRIKSTS